MRPKPLRFPNLKLVTKPNERDLVGDAGVGLQFVAQHHSAFPIHLQGLARAVERHRELFPLLRVGRKLIDQSFDLRQQRIAASVDRRMVECGIAVQTVEAVACEYGAIRSRNRDAPLGIEPQRVVRHEAIHTHTTPTRYSPTRRQHIPRTGESPASLGNYGITWDNLGVNGLRAARRSSAMGMLRS